MPHTTVVQRRWKGDSAQQTPRRSLSGKAINSTLWCFFCCISSQKLLVVNVAGNRLQSTTAPKRLMAMAFCVLEVSCIWSWASSCMRLFAAKNRVYCSYSNEGEVFMFYNCWTFMELFRRNATFWIVTNNIEYLFIKKAFFPMQLLNL